MRNKEYRRACSDLYQEFFLRIQDLDGRSVVGAQLYGILATVRKILEDKEDDDDYLEGLEYAYNEVVDYLPDEDEMQDDDDLEEIMKWLDGMHDDIIVEDL